MPLSRPLGWAGWRHRIPFRIPTSVVERSRFVFLVVAVLSGVGLLLPALASDHERTAMRKVLILGFAALVGVWWASYRAGRRHVAGVAVEAVAMLAVCLGAGAPHSALGVLFASTLYCAMFRDVRMAGAQAIANCAAFGAAVALSKQPAAPHLWSISTVAPMIELLAIGGLVAVMGRTIERTEREREWASVLASLGESLVVAPDSPTIFGTGLEAAMSLASPSGATGAAVLQRSQGRWEVVQATGTLCASAGRRLGASDVPIEWGAAGMQELHGAAASNAAKLLGCEGAGTHLLLAFGEAAQEEDATILATASTASFAPGTRVQIGIVAQQVALAAALDRSRVALVKTERLAAIGQLAATVSHELRNPLTAIRSAAAFIRRRVTPMPDGDRVREFFDIIEREVKASNRIVTELLDFARTRSLLRAPTDLRLLVEEVRQVVPLGRCRLTNAIPEDLPQQLLDRDQLRQVISNLVQNAGDAAPADHEGEIVVRARQAEDGTLTLEIEDDGPGMPLDVASRAFEPLFTTKSKGTGLGLAIVHKVVDAHGGTVRLEERAPHGCRFVIEIPPPTD